MGLCSQLTDVVPQVYLSVIEGYVPNKMVRAICSFLEFCYIACHDAINKEMLIDLEDALVCFYEYWIVFQEEGVCPKGFSLS